MHPVLRRTAPRQPRHSDLFVTTATWAGVATGSRRRRARFAEAAASSRSPAQSCCCRRADGALAGVLFGLEDDDGRTRDPFLPGRAAGPAAGRHLSLRQCAARCAACRARLRARHLSLHAATARPTTKDVRLVLPEGVDGAELIAHRRRRRRSRAISSTRRRTTWGRPSSKHAARDARRSARRERSSCIVGDDLLKQNFPLIHAVGRAVDRARRG